MDPFSSWPIWRKPTLPELSLAWYLYAQSLPGSCKSSREHGAFPDLRRLSAKGCSVNGLGMEAGQSSAACDVPSSVHPANLQHFLWTHRPPTKVPAAYHLKDYVPFPAVFCGKKCLGLGVCGLLESLIVLNHS